MKINIYYILKIIFLLLPINIIIALMIINEFALKVILKEFLFNSSILYLILTLVNVLRIKILKIGTSIILILSFYSVLFLKIFALINFFGFVDKVVLYTVFETNLEELTGFLNSYSRWYYYVIAIVYIYILIFLILKTLPLLVFKNKYYLEIILLFCTAVTYRFYERSFSLLLFNSFIEYKIYTSNVSKEISKKTSNYFTNVKNSDDEALYVVIIGESTGRKNMGIYDYKRNTNPRLNEIKNELFLFNDVISPHAQTIQSLDKVFSVADDNHPKNNILGTIIQLANAAGFNTYWLSNQNPIGAYESLITLYSKACMKSFFVSNLNTNDEKFDEVLIPKLQETIAEKKDKKMIFLHLKGSHISYHKNYPKSYQFFKDEPNTKFPSDESFKQINNYDNSIRYNDLIVSQIITSVKKANKNSYVLYFSDHGEEVFHDYDYHGHNENIGSNAMFEIPFIVWVSDEYKDKTSINFTNIVNRKYKLDDFIYSFSEISRITFDEFKPQKSIFNEYFKFKKRIILKNIDYDERLKKQ